MPQIAKVTLAFDVLVMVDADTQEEGEEQANLMFKRWLGPIIWGQEPPRMQVDLMQPDVEARMAAMGWLMRGLQFEYDRLKKAEERAEDAKS